MNISWRNRYDCAIEATRNAGKLALSHFDTGIAVEWKADMSPVTAADRATEEMLRKVISTSFPDDGFLGEEYGDQPGTSGFRWIIDPIDGTKNFIRNVPIWATLVGLEYKEEQIAGIVFIPTLNLLYRALRGDGAWREERRISVSDVAQLNDTFMTYSSMSWFTKAGRLETFLDLAGQCQRTRGFGDFYGFVLVAQGSCDFMLEHGVHAWDVAATKVLVEEAGGKFTDWEGTPTIHRPDVLASNGHLHDAVLKKLRPS
jgi:histidinol-phosphatase